MPIEFPFPPGGIDSDQLQAELRAAGVPAGLCYYDESTGTLRIGGEVSVIHKVAAQAAVNAHRPPAHRRPRKEADIVADLEAELQGQGINKPQAKLMAKLIAKQERINPGTVAEMGLTTQTTEPAPVVTTVRPPTSSRRPRR